VLIDLRHDLNVDDRRRPAMKPRPGRTPTPQSQFDKLPDLLSPVEASAYLRVSKGALYDRLREGRIEALRFGRLIRIPKSELLKK